MLEIQYAMMFVLKKSISLGALSVAYAMLRIQHAMQSISSLSAVFPEIYNEGAARLG